MVQTADDYTTGTAIRAQEINELDFNLANSTIGSLDVDITSQSIGDIDINLNSSSITLDTNISGSSVTIDTNIQSQSVDIDTNITSSSANVDTTITASNVTLDTDITSQSLGDIDINLNSQTISNIDINIDSQTLANLDTNLTTQSSIEIKKIAKDQTNNLASGGVEVIKFTPPTNTIWELKAVFIQVAPPNNATNGDNTVALRSFDTNIQFTKRVANFDERIDFFGTTYKNTTGDADRDTDVAVLNSVNNATADENDPIEIVYANNTDDVNDVQRNYRVLVKETKVS